MIRLACILALTFCLCACGVRGALYLPEPDAPEASAADQDPDREEATDGTER